MLAEIASPELLDIVYSTPENGSEIDSSQNGKKGSFSNLKKTSCFFKKTKKKNHY